MWPFFREKRRQTTVIDDESPPRRPMRFAALLEGMGDYDDLGDHDVALKFWVPEPVAEALDDLRVRHGDSMSELLRQFFAVHCYGLYAFQLMVDTNPGLFKDMETPRFSRRAESGLPVKKRVFTYFVPELGKNIAPIKLWVAGRLRDDLQILADHVGLKLSQYLREIVISRLLGHGALPMRPEMLKAIPNRAAEDWCDDPDIPWREVSEEEYRQASEGRVESAWGDLE